MARNEQGTPPASAAPALPTQPQLRMMRPDLKDLPPVELPDGYTIRAYQPGDGAHWTRVCVASFGRKPEDFPFDGMMRRDAPFRPERMFFACCGEEPVGTTSAWYVPTLMPDAGIVHWVGVVPGHAGRRLGRALVLAALHHMVTEGRARAILSTDDSRLPAIKSYLNCGFQPLLAHENQRERWRVVFAKLGVPELSERFKDILDGPVWTPPVHPQDEFDYAARVCRRFRWFRDRAPGRPQTGECDALADESLYRPSALGSAGCDVATVSAGEDRPFELWFRAGPAGLPTGAQVTFYTPGQNPLGTAPQVSDPAKAGFVAVTAAPRRAPVEPIALGFRVAQSSLREGDEVRLSVGSGVGFTWTPLAGRKELKVIVDVGAGEPLTRLPEPVVVRVLPLAADHVDVFLPATARRGETLRAIVTVRDRFDNRVPWDGALDVHACGESGIACLSGGAGHADIGPFPGKPERAAVSGGPLPGRALSNWCVPADGPNLYFGDLHCHDFTSPAEGWTADVYRWAIEDKRLDFLSLPVQCHACLDNDKWAIAKHMAEAFLDEGRFVTFLAFEWQHSHYGDKVVHYLGGDMPYLPVEDPRYNHPAALYEALRGADAFTISHHPGYALDLHVPGTDWDAVETDVDRLIEIWSMHGSSEGYDENDRPLVPPRREDGAMAALKKGLRMGIVAGSDTHSARPGGSAKEPRPYWGGLCAVWAESLTRRSLFDALMARRTYALTGARIVLRFSVNGAMMGSEIRAAKQRRLLAEVWAPARVVSVELMRDGEPLHVASPKKEVCQVEFEDKARARKGSAFYHCRVTLEDGHLAVCSPVWVG